MRSADRHHPPLPDAGPVVGWRRRRADRRELERTLAEVEHGHAIGVDAHLGALAADAAVVSRIALVEHRPTLRLLQLDFDGPAPSLLASVDHRTIADLSGLRLPALLIVSDVGFRRGCWSIEVTTLEQTVTIVADRIVAVDGLHRAAADGSE